MQNTKQYEKYLRLTIYENLLNSSKSYGKLEYVYVNESGIQDMDQDKHYRKIESAELNWIIDKFIGQTKMSEYQLERDGYIVKLDYHKARSFDRKKRILDAIAPNPKAKEPISGYYYPRQSREKKKSQIVSTLQVRYQNVNNVIRDGVTILAVASALFVAGKMYTAFTEAPQNDIVNFHKADAQVNKDERVALKGISRMNKIIDKMVQGKYSEVTRDDIEFMENYYVALGRSNNDDNHNFFDYCLYGRFEQCLNRNERHVFGHIQLLLNDMYKGSGVGNRYNYSDENALKYCIYAMTLVTGGEDSLSYEKSNKVNEVASTLDGHIFSNMRPEVKLPILINLREVLKARDFNFRNIGYNLYNIASYSFDKDKFIQRLDDQILLAKMQLDSLCVGKTRGK